MSATRIGIVGCGHIAQAYAQKLATLPSLDVTGCADLLPERAEALAEAHGIPRTLGVADLICDPDTDVVLNLTVPQAHATVSRAALDAGKAVYAEKPLALSFGEGRELVAAAERAGARLGSAPDTFLGAGLQTCRGLLDAGAIGAPVAATAFMLSPGPESWHPGPQIFYQRGAGPLFDMGPYYLTALVSLLGPALRITASARITHDHRIIGSEPLRGQPMQVEVPTHVACVIDFASGPVATLVTSFDVQASRHRWIEIHGTEGTLAIPDPNTFGGRVQICRSRGNDWQDVPLTHANAGQGRGLGLADMVSAQANGRPHRASGDLALHVLELMEGAIRASDEGAHIALTSTCLRPAALRPGLPDDDFGD